MENCILLDTNIVSELMRPDPDPAVREWFSRRSKVMFYVSSIVYAEVMLGISLLPTGKRKSALATAAKSMFKEDFNGRCLPFNTESAETYAAVVTARRSAGLPITTEDAQIAAIALAAAFPLATRNVKDFAHIPGLAVINPWHQT